MNCITMNKRCERLLYARVMLFYVYVFVWLWQQVMLAVDVICTTQFTLFTYLHLYIFHVWFTLKARYLIIGLDNLIIIQKVSNQYCLHSWSMVDWKNDLIYATIFIKKMDHKKLKVYWLINIFFLTYFQEGKY